MKRQPINDRSVAFSIDRIAHVASLPDVVIGLASRENDAAQIRIQGPVHRTHAVIQRRNGCYRIGPHPNRNGYVAIAGDRVEELRSLKDGDQIVLGHPHSESLRVDYQFQKLAGFGTAILHAKDANIAVKDGLTHDVVLLDDRLNIGGLPTRDADGPAHLRIRDLPCDKLTFQWTQVGLVVIAENGLVHQAIENVYDDPPEPLELPCRLRVEALPRDRLVYAMNYDPRANPMYFNLYDER